MATFTTTKPSEEETNKVYDRQIRLWGADAQRRIQASRVLFLGHLSHRLGHHHYHLFSSRATSVYFLLPLLHAST